MATVHIGIGSNMGERRESVFKALEALKQKGVHVTKVSSLYETEPWGVKEQPAFINMALEGETDLLPGELLAALKDIEREMGRDSVMRWGPRIIDLDVLFYDDIILERDDFRVPHPLLHERSFVLDPLCDIAPDKEHPVLKKSVRQLKEEMDNG